MTMTATDGPIEDPSTRGKAIGFKVRMQDFSAKAPAAPPPLPAPPAVPLDDQVPAAPQEHPQVVAPVPVSQPAALPVQQTSERGPATTGAAEPQAADVSVHRRERSKPTSLQLESEQVEFVITQADQARRWKGRMLETLLSRQLDRLDEIGPPPLPPVPQGPDDFAYYHQYTTRLSPGLLRRLDAVAEKFCESNRSHLARYLIADAMRQTPLG